MRLVFSEYLFITNYLKNSYIYETSFNYIEILIDNYLENLVINVFFIRKNEVLLLNE